RFSQVAALPSQPAPPFSRPAPFASQPAPLPSQSAPFYRVVDGFLRNVERRLSFVTHEADFLHPGSARVVRIDGEAASPAEESNSWREVRSFVSAVRDPVEHCRAIRGFRRKKIRRVFLLH